MLGFDDQFLSLPVIVREHTVCLILLKVQYFTGKLNISLSSKARRCTDIGH